MKTIYLEGQNLQEIKDASSSLNDDLGLMHRKRRPSEALDSVISAENKLIWIIQGQ